jgi:hypothetical protein
MTTINSQRLKIRLITVVIAVNLLLSFMLVLWPYFVSKPQGEIEYHVTHVTGLDPREHWPFSWQGLGLFLYGFSVFFALLTGPVALVLMIMQTTLLTRGWEDMHQWERSIHTGLVICTAFLLLVLLVYSGSIMEYLLD